MVFYNTSDYHQPWELISFTPTSDFHRRSPIVCTQPLWNSHCLLTCIFIVPVLCKEFVTPTGLEPVIFTVKGWCPNQLDDGAMKISVVIGVWSPHWFVNPIKISCHIGVHYLPWFSDGQTSESHSNSYQFSSWSNLLFALPQIPTPLSRNIQSSLIHFSHTLLINCITTSLGGHSTDQL